MIYLLGDYTDRGPRSKEVIDQIFTLRSEGFSVYPIRGNHDDMLLRACSSIDYLRIWRSNGGNATLDSFGVEDPCEIPLTYRRFFDTLPYYLELDDYILVHAGLKFQGNDPFRDKEAMLWTRSQVVDSELIGHRKVITGHTPVSRETIKQSISTGLIPLDNGCVYATTAQLGTLAALDLDSHSLYFQKNID